VHRRTACKTLILERITRILVRAGADRLNEGQPRRPRDELVGPHHGHAQEIELAKPRRELIERAHHERSPTAYSRH
jgi:hypothetical protein